MTDSEIVELLKEAGSDLGNGIKTAAAVKAKKLIKMAALVEQDKGKISSALLASENQFEDLIEMLAN